MFNLRVPLIFSLFLTPVSAFAQYTAGAITFSGAPPAQQRALEDTAQIHTGQAFTTADLTTFAQRLSDTGAFDDVGVTLDGLKKSVAVKFTVKPVPPSSELLVSISNLFWFTPQELDAGLHARVPLFGPALPEAGNLIDAVQAALEAMLKERSITARISHDVSEPSADRQARVVTFRVTKPLIVIQTIRLAGVTPEFAQSIRERAAKVSGTLLDDGLEHRSTNELLLLPYLDAGYIEARIAERKLTPLASTPDKITLELAGTVVPGPLLHVGTLTWAGSPELSAADFAAHAPLKSGALASLTALGKTNEYLAGPFYKQGYADVVVNATPAVVGDTVNYTFTVTPGEQYRIRTIKPVNFSAEQQAAFDRAWQMKAGDLFNPDYIFHFFGKDGGQPAFQHDTVAYRAERDPAAHLVDVTLTLFGGTVDAKP